MATFYEKHCRRPDQIPALAVQLFTLAHNNLAKRNWFHSLPSRRFQALLTLFPKYFSSFPHGTCLLSVSNQYLALEENYLPFCAPLPKYTTLRNPSVCPNQSTCTGLSPCSVLSSKKTYAAGRTGEESQDYNSRASSRLAFWAHPGSFAITNGIMFIFFSSTYLYA
jgi:hypothetical protein